MAAAKLTARSLAQLATCHRDLQRLVHALVADGVALHVICGHRGKYDQDKAFAEGKSKLKFPRSKHNTYPSKAMDITPHPIDWNATKEFVHLAELVKAKAAFLEIKLVWGGDWPMRDLVHFELA